MRPCRNQFPAQDPGPIRIALVGEACGDEEEARGVPFCGTSGWHLSQWLNVAGTSREQCFVGNVCQHRPAPGKNQFDLLDWRGGAVQEGIAALAADLHRYGPTMVVPLGNAALHLMRHGNVAPPKSRTGKFQWRSHITTWRGSIMSVPRLTFPGSPGGDPQGSLGGPAGAGASHAFLPGDASLSGSIPDPRITCPTSAHAAQGEPASAVSLGVYAHETGGVGPFPAGSIYSDPSKGGGSGVVTPVLGPAGSLPATWKAVPTIHPAAALRQWSWVFSIINDLKRAVREARSPSLDLPVRNIAFGLSVDEVEARCARLRESRATVGFDIEGGARGLQCMGFATSPSEAFVVDFLDVGSDGPRLYKAVLGVVEDAGVRKVCWNAAYERAILRLVAGVTMRSYEDPMLAWWERYSELPQGLDFVASILTRQPYWAEGIGWDKRTGLPKVRGERLWTYNGIDCCTTLEIWKHPLIQRVVTAAVGVPWEVAA